MVIVNSCGAVNYSLECCCCCGWLA